MDKNRKLMTNGTYALKPRFQLLLAPVLDWLIAQKFSANQITLITAFLCIAYAFLLTWPLTSIFCLYFLPLFLLIRMALNALDGMLATKTATESAVGIVLNEVGDLLSDIFLFGAFIFILPEIDGAWILLLVLCMLIEFVSLAIFMAIGERPILGPFAKSDRALYLGLLALLLIFSGNQIVVSLFIALGILLALLTLWNRLQVLARKDKC